MNRSKGFVAACRLMLGPVGLLSDHQLSTLWSVGWRVNGGMRKDNDNCLDAVYRFQGSTAEYHRSSGAEQLLSAENS
jgi:hypothetical protein